ncbi:MAG: hypothetical protein ACYTKD_21370 [Planctomycetota bacterium]|jgi:hypothetical protein
MDYDCRIQVWGLRAGRKLYEGPEGFCADSPDGNRIACVDGDYMKTKVFSTHTGRLLFSREDFLAWPISDTHMVVRDESESRYGLYLYRRIRPEWWWGVFWLPHFWLIVVLGVSVVASGLRDLRRMRRREREAG